MTGEPLFQEGALTFPEIFAAHRTGDRLGGFTGSSPEATGESRDCPPEAAQQEAHESAVLGSGFSVSIEEDRLTALSQQVLSRTQLEVVILQFDLYREERQAEPASATASA